MQEERDARVCALPPGEDLGQDTDGYGVHGGDVQFPALRARGGAGRPPGLDGAAHGELRVRQEGAAHRGEPDATRQPLQEWSADGLLQ